MFPHVALHCRLLKASREHNPAAFAAKHAGELLRSALLPQSEEVVVVLWRESNKVGWMILLLKAGNGLFPPAMVFNTNAGLLDLSLLYKVRWHDVTFWSPMVKELIIVWMMLELPRELIIWAPALSSGLLPMKFVIWSMASEAWLPRLSMEFAMRVPPLESTSTAWFWTSAAMSWAWLRALFACCWILLTVLPVRALALSIALVACFCTSLPTLTAWPIAALACCWTLLATFSAWVLALPTASAACFIPLARALPEFFPALPAALLTSSRTLLTALLMFFPTLPNGFRPPNYKR